MLSTVLVTHLQLLPVYELYVGMYDKKKEQIYDMYTCVEHTCQVLKYFEYRKVGAPH